MWLGWDEVLSETPSRGWTKFFVFNPFIRSTVSGKRLFLQKAYKWGTEYFTSDLLSAYVKRYYLSEKEYMWRVIER